MTDNATHLTDFHAEESPALENRPTLLAHATMIVAMAVVAVAAARYLATSWSMPQANAAAIGLGLFAASAVLHWAVSARSRAPAVHPGLADQGTRPRKGRRRKVQASAAAKSAQTTTAESEAPVRARPTELALELLARSAAPMSQGAVEPTDPRPLDERELLHTSSRTGMALASLTASGSREQPSTLDTLPDMSPVAVEETELQRVDRLVRRLADHVNQIEAGTDKGTLLDGHAPTPEPHEPSAPAFADTQLAASIHALKAGMVQHEPMRPATGLPPVTFAAPPPVPMAAPEPEHLKEAEPREPSQLAFDLAAALSELPKWPEPDYPRAADPATAAQRTAILSAINAQRIDVYLEPILDLGDHRPQHYEVSIGLRASNGQLINLAGIGSDLSGTGLLPLIDSARISRAANLARRLAERGKTGAVFTGLSGETLADDDFYASFSGPEGAGAFPGQMVLTLPQSHVRLFTTADWQTMGRLRVAGFAFALSDVTTLEMDFGSLRAAGFAFVRLDAETFLIGLPMAGATVPPDDICRHIAATGLALIVGGIVEDHQLARIFGFGVLFGQGELFGGPRSVAATVAARSSGAAVAAE